MTETAAIAEEVIGFKCSESQLWGILGRPATPGVPLETAVLIVIGGPQYRVGSHRQFVLLARALAGAGFPTLRFDYTGMGDSEGDRRAFDAIGPDVRAAIDALCQACPAARRIVVWGLCDAASAALIFAAADARVAGIVAANPWARSPASLAAAQVKYYYVSRLLQREFWTKLLRGRLDWRASFRALSSNLKGARSHYRQAATGQHDGSFQLDMARGLAGFRGRVLLILSGNDLTAKEFLDYASSSAAWKGLLDDPKVSRVDLPEADHTFSRRNWLDVVETETITWLNRLSDPVSRVAAASKTS